MPSPDSLDQLFAEAIERPRGADREAWMRQACGDDIRLERELRLLVESHESSGSFMKRPLVDDLEIDGRVPTSLGPYRIDARIGSGGMGVVYRAFDLRLDRTVALKMLPAYLTADARRLARLEHEARTLAALNHPNIGAIYGIEEHDGSRFLVLEHVDGETLAERLERGAMSVDRALDTCAQIAAGIEASHDAGIVHRDLKPANVKITPDERVKVLDFGIAKTASPKNNASATATGAIFGTASYMSPEQARGEDVDRRTDIWSFGVILCECLTGTNPFRAQTPADSISAILAAPIKLDHLPRDVPPAARYVLSRSLQRDARKRLRDMRDVRLSLEGDTSVSGSIFAMPRLTSSWWRIGPGAAAVLALLVLTMSLLLVVPRGWMAAATSDASTPMHVAVAVSLPTSLWGGRRTILLSASPDGHSKTTMLLWGDAFVAAAISPDGRRIAYIGVDPNDHSRFPPPAIYVRSLHSAAATRLPGTEDAARLSFSPDGSQLAFVWRDRTFSKTTEVRRVGIDGGSVTTVVRDEDASSLYRYSTPGWLSERAMLIVSGPKTALLRVPIDGGEPTTVAEFGRIDADDYCHAYDPILAPDRRSVLLTTMKEAPGGPRKTLVRVDLESGAVATLVDDAEYGIVDPAGYLLFVRRSALLAAPLDLATMTLTGPSIEIAPRVEKGPVSCSNDGTLVFARDATNPLARPLMTMQRGGTRSTLSEITAAFQGSVCASADGRLLAVNILDAMGGLRAHVYEIEQKRLRPIRDAEHERTSDAWWLPDGRLVYTAWSGDHASLAIGNADLEATGKELLDKAQCRGLMGKATITPDGRYVIADYTIGGSRGIGCVDLDGPPGTTPIMLAPGGIGAAVSPDGKWLAYSRPAPTDLAVHVRQFAPAGTAGPREVQISTTIGQRPFWSADGSELFFIDWPDQHVMGVRFEVRDGAPRFSTPERVLHVAKMGRLRRATESEHPVDALPDGRFVYVGKPVERMPSHLDVAINWAEELE